MMYRSTRSDLAADRPDLRAGLQPRSSAVRFLLDGAAVLDGVAFVLGANLFQPAVAAAIGKCSRGVCMFVRPPGVRVARRHRLTGSGRVPRLPTMRELSIPATPRAV